MNLFTSNSSTSAHAPLADRMRPRTLDDYEGQKQIIGKDAVLRRALERDEVPSMIFWGPPGTGKTTLAQIIAGMTGAHFTQFSAVGGSVKQVREIAQRATDRLAFQKIKTVLFVDEIHRFSKLQQDAFLPHVEAGTIILIGATTENPSFEVNSALLSRARVFVLNTLEPEHIIAILKRAMEDEVHGLGGLNLNLDEDVLTYLAMLANGDARSALNALELAVQSSIPTKEGVVNLKKEDIAASMQRSHLLYDKGGEEHYNIISALHKSIRGSDADASLYWTQRMLEGGEDPLYIARRLVRAASEDIGLADPRALEQAVAGYQACHFIGMPECGVILAQVAVYLARAPKSVSVYQAYKRVQKDIAEQPTDGVPLHLRNAPTKLMKNLGYGKGYQYPPSHKDGAAGQSYLPDRLKNRRYLDPEN